MKLLSMAIAAVLINNIVLAKFLGVCPFLGVSKNSKSAIGMGLAVIFVIFSASMLTYGVQYLILKPLGIEYMQLISFILIIAAFVQFVEMFMKKNMPGLYASLGVYLPLITTNCTVLYVAQDNISKGYNLIETIVNSIATPLGFLVVMYLFSCIRERLDYATTPKPFKGNPIGLIVAGLMALAFAGLAGIA